MLFESGDKPGAKAQLAFVIDRSAEDELKQIARLRLAAILFDDKQYDEALRTLDAKHDESFAGIYADCGDILFRIRTHRGKRNRLPTRLPDSTYAVLSQPRRCARRRRRPVGPLAGTTPAAAP
jgi:predicted negative regulator of RcsB-dependent stress response